MAYQVHWQLVGRSGQPLDRGCLGEGLCAFGDAVATVVEFLRQYQEVDHCPTESYWLARRSIDADLAVWVWIERHETKEATRAVGAWLASTAAEEQMSTPCREAHARWLNSATPGSDELKR